MSVQIISRGKRKVFALKGILASAAVCVAAPTCFASAFVGGAYYQLGDADPGAVAGQPGNSITQDTFSGDNDLSRIDTPKYSAEVPPRGPLGDKLSMQFANIGLGGPTIPGSYGRTMPIDATPQGIVLEAWAKLGPFNLDLASNDFTGTMVVAYDQGPNFGLFVHDSNYVARFGSAEFKLGPAEVGAWHHLAYVRNFNLHSFYYDGNLISTVVQDPLPGGTPGSGGFWVGGVNDAPGDALLADLSGNTSLGFNGWIDEVRLQTFNPLAAGAFEPTAFLISPAPEPSSIGVLALAAGAAACRRRRH
jgi:hypothetical protein